PAPRVPQSLHPGLYSSHPLARVPEPLGGGRNKAPGGGFAEPGVQRHAAQPEGLEDCLMPPPRRLALALALLGGLALVGALGGRDAAPTPHFRRPAALAVTADGRWLFTATRKHGPVSVIDAQALRPAAQVAP